MIDLLSLGRMVMTTWILVANASEATLYQSENLRKKALILLKTFQHPESREKDADLVSDQPGHFNTSHKARGAYEKSDPKEIEVDNFARELCEKLDAGRRTNQYNTLLLIAAPSFHGLLNKHLNQHQIEVLHIPKDYTKCKEDALIQHIQENLYQ